MIEFKCLRLTPHSSDDNDRTYRSPDEVKAWRARDPLALFEARLREVGVFDDDGLVALKARIMSEVDAATEAAELAPLPDPATFDHHVYGDG